MDRINEVDDIWMTCYTLHNWLLAIDGLMGSRKMAFLSVIGRVQLGCMMMIPHWIHMRQMLSHDCTTILTSGIMSCREWVQGAMSPDPTTHLALLTHWQMCQQTMIKQLTKTKVSLKQMCVTMNNNILSLMFVIYLSNTFDRSHWYYVPS